MLLKDGKTIIQNQLQNYIVALKKGKIILFKRLTLKRITLSIKFDQDL